jgi:hypothetical protein
VALVAAFMGVVLTTAAMRHARVQWAAVHEGRLVSRRRTVVLALLRGTLALQWLAVLLPIRPLWPIQDTWYA